MLRFRLLVQDDMHLRYVQDVRNPHIHCWWLVGCAGWDGDTQPLP